MISFKQKDNNKQETVTQMPAGFLFVEKARVKRKLEKQLKTIRNVCKSAPRSLFWVSTNCTELPEIRF